MFKTLLDSSSDQVPRGEPAAPVEVQLAYECLADQRARLQEPCVLRILARHGVVPRRIKAADERRKRDGFVVEGGRDVGGVRGDAVVIGVKGFDKVGVDLCVEEVGGRRVRGERETVGDDVARKVLVDQPRGGELGVVGGGEGFGESALVVVKMFGAVIFALNLEEGGVGVLVLCNFRWWGGGVR